ncbi:N-acetylmuramoyl-L-alanine amidase [Halobacillus sp. Marseille-P3879]|uniref:N-acetylmuramoyl-L-alanine amidase n=1 Tax=Halobacillus sp. Marseille-P3879 TaxID=2045014 RepID=UPI000C7A1B9D|nr:N-acetylmuramoyl-L-alanine amidase [Halobacillus sp. Marseille-P3879]
MAHFEKLSQLKDLRGKTAHNGWQPVYDVSVKTDIAIHHSLTKEGDSYSFANYHVHTNGWHEIAYAFVILKDGTIEWNHDLGVLSYHVGNSNKFAVGICLVGDFRSEKPTEAQKRSLKQLVDCLKKDMPNYKRTRGHNEFPGYSWKACPEFDYRAVCSGEKEFASVPASGASTHTIQQGDTFWSIANENEGLSVDDLKKLNPSVDPSKLKIGEKIKIKETASKPAPKPASNGDMKTTSIVTYLKSIGVDSSFNYRAKLAAKYGISRYKGTAPQNISLLSKMRGGSKSAAPKTATPKKSSSPVKGKIKIIGVNSAAIVMDKPDRNSSKNIGTIKKNATVNISGSVKGKNNPRGYWEVIYDGKRGYVSGQFGRKV